MVVVFGDASWRWSDLLVDPDQAAPAPSGTNKKVFQGRERVIRSRVGT